MGVVNGETSARSRKYVRLMLPDFSDLGFCASLRDTCRLTGGCFAADWYTCVPCAAGVGEAGVF